MPDKNGFELLDELKNQNCNHFEVIFYTCCCESTMKAIKYGAFDYLVKPLKDGDLEGCLIRFMDKRNNIGSVQLENTGRLTEKNKKIKLLSSKGYLYIYPEDVLFIKGHKLTSELTDKDNTLHHICYNLKTVLEILNSPILKKVHKSYAINEKYLYSYNKKTKSCEVKTGEHLYSIPVSRRGSKHL
jgi:two-component system LytT family response regulator